MVYTPRAPAPSPGNFSPSVITVNSGEDIFLKVLTYAQREGRAVCVLSVCGPVSTVTVRHLHPPPATVTYQGRFELMSMTGSIIPTDVGYFSRASGIKVTLAAPGGPVIAGELIGPLVAGGLVQLVLGTIKPSNGTTLPLVVNRGADGVRRITDGANRDRDAPTPAESTNQTEPLVEEVGDNFSNGSSE